MRGKQIKKGRAGMNENNSPSPGLKATPNASSSSGTSAARIIGLILLIGGCLVLAFLLYKWRFLVFGAAPGGRPTADFYEQMALKEYVTRDPSLAFPLYFSECGFGYAGIAAVLGLILTLVGKKK
jgi:hypothetical protein